MRGESFLVETTPHLLERASFRVRGKESQYWDEEKARLLIDQAVERARSTNLYLDSLKRIDLSKILIRSPGLNETFDCLFFHGRKARILRTRRGYCYYYSKKPIGKGVYRFDLFDLMAIFQGRSLRAVFQNLEKTWGIPGITSWYLAQHEKYLENEEILKRLSTSPEKKSALQKLCSKHWDVLRTLNRYAFDHVVQAEDGGETIFFISLGYLTELVRDFSISTITSVVNMFVLLGFLDKIPLDDVPEKMAVQAKLIKSETRKDSTISFYSLPRFKDRLEEAEEKAGVLVSAGIPYYRITRHTIRKLFGEDEAKKVYVQKTYGRKRRGEPVYVTKEGRVYSEKERLERMFVKELEETGKCEKRMLKESSTLPAYRFDQYWKELVEKYNCHEIFPTNREMGLYGMERRRLVAVPTP